MSRRGPRAGDLNLEELRKAVDASNMTPKNKEAALAAFDALVEVTHELSAKRASLGRLRRLIFGSRTEKRSNLIPEQTPTAPEAQAGAGEQSTTCADPAADLADAAHAESKDEQGQDNTTNGEKKRQRPRGHGRNKASCYSGATHTHVPLDSVRPGDVCHKCKRGKLRPVDPMLLVRLYGAAPIFARAWDVEQLRCAVCGELFTAEIPPEVGPEKYDNAARAVIPIIKYDAGMPFNRLARLQKCFGIPLPASVQWELCSETAESVVVFVFLELVKVGAQYGLLHNDDTPARILGPIPRRDPETDQLVPCRSGEPLAQPQGPRPPDRSGTYTTAVIACSGERRIAIYMTGWQHAGENLQEVMRQRDPSLPKPIQMSDALSRNYPPGFETIIANCLTHARRNFADLIDEFPSDCKHVIDELAKVYEQDHIATVQGLSKDQRLQLHQKVSGPIMADLQAWMQKQLDEKLVEPNSELGQAIRYMNKHWDALTLFLRVPGAPLDNNLCERCLKIAILHRKNAMFFRTARGASVADIFMTVIHTTRLASKNPFHYLVSLLDHKDLVKANPSQWLPWNYEETISEMAKPMVA